MSQTIYGAVRPLCAMAVIAMTLRAFAGAAEDTPAKPAKPNVLFVCMDDLRHDYATFGDAKAVQTPNLYRLAAEGLRFKHAYAQYPICMPSRASLLSGYRPETIHYTGRVSGRVPKGTVTLPQLFRNHDYTTVSIGKIYHENDDNPAAWTRRYTDTFDEGTWCNGYCSDYRLQANKDTVRNYLKGLRYQGKPASHISEIVDKSDESTPDGRSAQHAIDELRGFKKSGEPFFLAVGFYRPHMPLTAPKKYWEMYDREAMTLPENFRTAASGPRDDWGEVRRYGDCPTQGPMPEDKAKEIIQGYRASVTFVDAQFGKVLDELQRLALDDNTVVLLWSDNGWRLGEHGLYSKPQATEIPSAITLIVKVPWLPAQKSTDALMELVDIYPTLAELCNLKVPGYLEGTSAVPLLKDPTRPWKKAVFTSVAGKQLSIRTDRYRLITTGKTIELYDYQTDPDEDHNLADDPAHAALVKELLEQLHAGWKAARPE